VWSYQRSIGIHVFCLIFLMALNLIPRHMKRTLLSALFTFVLFSGDLFSQASACPTVNAGPDQTICPGQCVNLTATVQGTLQTSTYAISNIPYSPYSYTTGTPVLVNIDDVWTSVINMPFCFQFFGNSYTQLVIGSNGLISFNTAYANAYCQWPISAAIPSIYRKSDQLHHGAIPRYRSIDRFFFGYALCNVWHCALP
jgi:hypothetical protein